MKRAKTFTLHCVSIYIYIYVCVCVCVCVYVSVCVVLLNVLVFDWFSAVSVFVQIHILLFLCFSALSTYDPNYCYILDGLLLLYGIIITAFFVRERVSL